MKKSPIKYEIGDIVLVKDVTNKLLGIITTGYTAEDKYNLSSKELILISRNNLKVEVTAIEN